MLHVENDVTRQWQDDFMIGQWPLHIGNNLLFYVADGGQWSSDAWWLNVNLMMLKVCRRWTQMMLLPHQIIATLKYVSLCIKERDLFLHVFNRFLFVLPSTKQLNKILINNNSNQIFLSSFQRLRNVFVEIISVNISLKSYTNKYFVAICICVC